MVGKPEDAARVLAQRDASCSTRHEFVFSVWGLGSISRALVDERDLPAAQLLANVMLTTLPAALVMLVWGSSHVVGALYCVSGRTTHHHHTRTTA